MLSLRSPREHVLTCPRRGATWAWHPETRHLHGRGHTVIPRQPGANRQNSEVAAPFGILNIDKPAGCTSRDAVNRIDRLVLPAKCGHAGTLDPLATGVLVVCVGHATRLIQYVQHLPKRYEATFQLGRRSRTDDIEGEIELLADAIEPSRETVEAALPQFLGKIEQRPPAHSAIKVGGQRAYERARRGEVFELAARTVTIHRLAIRRYDYPQLELEIECGSGTYVRSLGRDLAAALGTAAVMSALVRTAIGEFRVEEAVPLDALSAGTLPQHLQPALTALANLQRIELNDWQLVEIRSGRPIRMPRPLGAGPGNRGRVAAAPPQVAPPIEWAAIDAAGQLVAILTEKNAGELWPVRNFES
jgi:tRNA pseudouridine55 synthase